MATVKRSEIEKQIAALQSQLDSADTDDEIWIRDGDHEIKVTGKRATSILGRYAHLWETNDDAETESEEDATADTEDDSDTADAGATRDVSTDEKPAQRGYFGRKG